MGTLLIRVVDDTAKSRHVSSAAVAEVATGAAVGVAVGVVAAGVATTARRPVPTIPSTKTSSASRISMLVTRSRLHCARDGGVLFFSSCGGMGGNAEEYMVVSTTVP